MTIAQPATVELGTTISKHHIRFSRKWGSLAVSILLILLGPIVYFGLPLYLARLQGAASQTAALGYIPLILGIVLPLVGIARLWEIWINWPLAVDLCEHGMSYTDRKGTRQIRWEDVKEIYQYIVRHYYLLVIPVGTDYSYRLQTSAGEMILFDARYNKVKKLGETLQERIAAAQVPGSLAEIQAGKRLDFGALSLDQEGIYRGNKLLKWDEVGDVTLRKGTLSIVEKGSKWGTWFSMKAQDLPNATLIRSLIEKYPTTKKES